MADAATTNHNLILPEIGASKDSWGTKLNQNLTKIDQLLKVGLGTFVNRAGDTMTGLLTLPTTNPTAGTHATHKNYVDGQVANLNTAINARALASRTLTGGSGITTVIGDLSADRVISVDDTVVRTVGNQTIAGMKTLAGLAVTSLTRLSMPGAVGEPVKEIYYNAAAGGPLGFYDRTNNRWDLQIDANGNLTPRGTMNASNLSGVIDLARIPMTVVQDTEVTQSIGGAKVWGGTQFFDGGVANIRAAAGSDKQLWFRDVDNTPRGILYHSVGLMRLALYSDTNLGVQVARLDMTQNGNIQASVGRFAGDGSGLTDLPAGSLTGFIPNARMSGNYSWGSLDLSGRLLVTGINGWATPGVQINGNSPNIHFRQADGSSAIVGTNEGSFYVLADNNGDGVFDNIALQVNLDSAGVFHRGTQLAYMTNGVLAGAGMTGGGTLASGPVLTLGTPTAITATSGNTVSATSHTHALGESAVRALLAEGLRGQVGTYAQATKKTAGDVDAATAVAGSALAPAADGVDAGVGAFGGTWRCMGFGKSGAGTLWLRIT